MNNLKNALKRLEFLCLLHKDVMSLSDIAVILRYIAESGLSRGKANSFGISFLQFILFHDCIETSWDKASEVIANIWLAGIKLDWDTSVEYLQLVDALNQAAVYLSGCDQTKAIDKEDEEMDRMEKLKNVLKELEFLNLLNKNSPTRNFTVIEDILRFLGRSGLFYERVYLFGRIFLRHIYDDKYKSWDEVITAIVDDWNDKSISKKNHLTISWDEWDDLEMEEYLQIVKAIKRFIAYHHYHSNKKKELEGR